MISGLEALSSLDRDIAKMNFDYLRMLREVARQCLMTAQQRFGVSGSTARRVARMTLEDLQILADSPNFLMTVRSTAGLDIMMTSLLAPDCTKVQIEGLRFTTLLADQQSPASRFRDVNVAVG